MQLGFGLPSAGAWATPQNMRQIATRAEELGYSSLWTFQRLLHPVDGEWGPAYHSVVDPITALAYVAGVTSRIRLGVAVVNMPYYAPVVLAKALTTLDLVSAGRLDAGLGLGWAPPEFEAVGVPYERRGRRGEEFVACLKAIWTQPEVEFHGTFYDVPLARIEPKPVQQPHPPILLGGAAERALQRAGRIAEGWISSSRAELTTISDSIAVVRSAATDAGRNADALRFVVRGVVKVRPDAGPDRKPLHGTVEQIRGDLAMLAGQGITEVFIDLNYDPMVVSPEADPAESMRHAERVLAEFAPTAAG